MAASSQTILLAGASGYIGRAVAAELRRRGYEVIAMVRSAASGEAAARLGCEVLVAPLDGEGDSSELPDLRADAAISCIASRSGVPEDAWRVEHRANCNLLKMAEQAGARHFVLLSAICVQKPRLEFQRAKLAFEQVLRESALTWSIVRPTAFFKSLSGQVERVRQGKPFLLFGDGTATACKPISERDLAAYIVDCLEDPARHNRILPIGGPGNALTPREQGALLFEAAGMPPRYRQVPPQLFKVVLALLAPFRRFSKRIDAKAELARIGHYYATESMLAWDAERERYDAEATPGTGTDTLAGHYAAMLENGGHGQDLGEHKLF